MKRYISWNVNGLRAAQKKGFAESVLQLNADCICIQETKQKATVEVDEEHASAAAVTVIGGFGDGGGQSALPDRGGGHHPALRDPTVQRCEMLAQSSKVGHFGGIAR